MAPLPNIKVKMFIKLQVCRLNNHSDPELRPPTEGNQWTEKYITTGFMSGLSFKSFQAALKAGLLNLPE